MATRRGDILREVEAKSIKERNEGIKHLRQWLEIPGELTRITKSKSTTWEDILDALYTNLTIERDAYDKARGKVNASTASVEKRLTDTAMLIRHICENVGHNLSDRVVRKLIRNLKDRMRRNTMTLLEPVVLDFVKASKILLSYPPHMYSFTSKKRRKASRSDDEDEDSDEDVDALDEIQPRERDWVELTSMAFNVVLDQPLNRRITAEDEDDAMDVDASSDAQDEEDDEEDEDDDGRASPRKRSRPTSSHYPASRASPAVRGMARLSNDTREKREWIGLLSVLVSTHRNPMFHSLPLTPRVLGRISRILQSYTADSSIHHELLPALSCVLGRLCLSQSAAVKKFSMDSWDSLVSLWGPKAKPFREHLIAALTILLPYHVHAGKKHDWGEGLERLYKVMEKEVGASKGLSLDALRLEVDMRYPRDEVFPAFSTPTLRVTASFDQAQALIWATLELEADCIVKLYERSESIHSYVTATPTQRDNKRTRLENPLKSILASLLMHSSADTHTYRLQTLVFVIERHWPTLHYDLQQDVKRTLSDVMAAQNQNSTIQSWVFIAFAAIAYAESRSPAKEADSTAITPDNLVSWEALWSSCMRRSNVPSVCRAACHAAVAILAHAYQAQHLPSPLPVSSTAILAEIETLMKGLESQGPAFPCDSVCLLLSRCLHIASQDARLYRMRMEDIALAWLVECWRVDPTSKGTLPLYSVPDMLRLLGSICSYQKVPDLLDRVQLPACPITETLEQQAHTRVMRDFLLEAKVPSYHPPAQLDHSLSQSARDGQDPDETEEAEPSARETKISKFLGRCLERLVDARPDDSKVPTAEAMRSEMCVAVIALAFEAMRKDNGIKRDKIVVKRAMKLMCLLTKKLLGRTFMDKELAVILHAFDPLLRSSDPSQEFTTELFASVAPGAGIRSQLIRRLAFDSSAERRLKRDSRITFQRVVWGDNEIEMEIGDIRRHLSAILDRTTQVAQATPEAVQDDADFAAVREVIAAPNTTADAARQQVIETCVCGLYAIQYLQSGQQTRANEFDRFFESLKDHWQRRLHVLHALVDGLETRMLHMSSPALADILMDFNEILPKSRDNECLQLLVVRILHATMPTWTSDVVDAEDFEVVGIVNEWLSEKLRRRDFDWKVRSRLASYLAAHVEADREEARWTDSRSERQCFRVESGKSLSWYYPRALLPWLVGDVDSRVSFYVSSLLPRVLHLGTERHILDEVVHYVYDCLGECRGRSLESLLATILAMANMMITTVVRRRTYWNLLDSYFEAPSGNQRFMESVLRCILTQVAQRIGMTQPTELFDAYASQIAYSMIKSGKDLNRLPPTVLGYRDRLQCIAAAFRAFAPYLIGEKEYATFKSYCTLLGKQDHDGVRECFGDVVGDLVARDLDVGGSADQIAAAAALDQATFDAYLAQSMDAVTVAILRAMGELKLQVIKDTLAEQCIQEMADTFRCLTRYREDETISDHDEMVPSYSCTTIIRCLQWCNKEGGNAADDLSRTFHILHELFADVQHHYMVVDQRRTVNALCIWISACSQHFDDNAVLYALLHGATVMLGHSDLVSEAQSILDWALGRYGENFSREHANGQVSERTEDPRFLDIFIRISSCANAYKFEAGCAELQALGERLALWIDRKTAQICDAHGMTQQILRVLPAWPYRPVDQYLLALHDGLGPNDLSSVLANKRVTTNKFALARRLREYALAGAYDPADFAKRDFWHLKSHIPDVERLDPEDVEAFAILLVSNQGRIDSFSDAALESVKASSLRKPQPRVDIIVILADMLRSEDGARVYAAYSTLKLLMTVVRPSNDNAALPDEFRSSRHLTTEQKADLRHIMAYSCVLRKQDKSELYETLRSDNYMRLTRTFDPWISDIAYLLSKHLGQSDVFYAQLHDMLKTDVEFATTIFPILLHTLLHWEQENARSEELRYRQAFSVYFTSILRSDTAPAPCKEVIVRSVLHLRHYQPSHSGKEVEDACAYDMWLDIDYLLLAQSALTCRMYTTSLLFLDLATEYNPSSVEEGSENVLYEIYRHIDEPDGFYAIKTNDLQQFLLRRVHHERQWDKAFRLHGAGMETARSTTGDQLGLLRSFHAFGFHGLALNAMPALAGQSDADIAYELGWRTGTWDLPDNKTAEDSRGASLYFALRAVHRERDSTGVDKAVQHALLRDMAQLRALGEESLSEIREVARSMMCLSQVALWNHPDFQAVLTTRDAAAPQWREFVQTNDGLHFQDLENIVATRICLLQTVRQKEEREQIGDMLSPWMQMLVATERHCLVHLSTAARQAREVQVALNAITRAQRLGHAATLEIEQEYANVLWVLQEKRLAIESLRRLLEPGNPLSAQTNEIDMAVLKARMGTWTAEACLEKPDNILRNWFGPAVDLLSQVSGGSPKKRTEVYRQCASFAERQYYTLFRSPEGRRWKLKSERKQKELEAIDRTPKEQQTIHKRLRQVIQMELDNDRAIMKEHMDGLEAFLAQSLDMHSRCLAVGDAYDDDAPIRLCSLWFANWRIEKVQAMVDNCFRRIPSRKLVFLSHQLSARLSKGDEQTQANQTTLRKLVVRMCKEHPFHCLYQVFCLQVSRRTSQADISDSNRRQSARQTPGSTSSSEPPTATQMDRSETAGELYDKLKDEDTRAQAVDRLCCAALEWATFPIAKPESEKKKYSRSGVQYKVPSKPKLFKLRDWRVPVMTVQTPLDATSRYENCAWLVGYESTFSTMGGLALPKVSKCRDVYGQSHKELFKGEGNDDLRQDAVMEQVFELCNSILQRDQETRRRRLTMRCYKVVPLAAQAGVLQFVTNTAPLNAWIPSAHARYHPDDIPTRIVQKQLKDTQEMCTGKSPQHPIEYLTSWFAEIVTKRHRPVMRYFFREKHKEPTAWFATRLNYTRSVAVTSIVGHVLGLGDRHLSNILLDQHNGEVVHIDLGIAFDQGRVLPVPEKVPFRLTRDMVDGMGASGTQGVFQRCAEETLRVLRGGSEIILAVLEVFKHDPLHSWTANEHKLEKIQRDAGVAAEKARRRKKEQEKKANASAADAYLRATGHDLDLDLDLDNGTSIESADRALMSVARKLDGSLSVEFTVNELIAEATDMQNLATIFTGWSPHC
ncbi:uncharacterized protein SCHCODRAFT_02228065 [Schizophyllum commune H4-8]|uniref:uncharacterized protein n=1 Tax=Schizophyllum commune (strain H4-8 / FGSC 9210) TaxID=578458 RepID=UPI00215FEF36|nr:uncharacterized protein SCHCODRAFT_02228065 [Schizophyllum commune H4-8]KAI5895314.1 hypothetical protein SCHCODRAFT_02228065 [Schizophyllum commune H4-8]